MQSFIEAMANGDFAMFAEGPSLLEVPPADPALPDASVPTRPTLAPQTPELDPLEAAFPKYGRHTAAPWHTNATPTPPPQPVPTTSADSSWQNVSSSWQNDSSSSGWQTASSSSDWQTASSSSDWQTVSSSGWQQQFESDKGQPDADTPPTGWTRQEWWENKEETRLAHENKIRWQDRGAPPGDDTGKRFKGQVWRAGSERYGNRGGKWSGWYSVWKRGASKADAQAEANASKKD